MNTVHITRVLNHYGMTPEQLEIDTSKRYISHELEQTLAKTNKGLMILCVEACLASLEVRRLGDFSTEVIADDSYNEIVRLTDAYRAARDSQIPWMTCFIIAVNLSNRTDKWELTQWAINTGLLGNESWEL